MTQKDIMSAAVKLFAQKGFSGASMNGIAALAGVTKPAIYYHFKNKEELYQAVIRRSMDRFFEGLEQTLSVTSTLFDFVHQWFSYHFLFAVQNRDFISLIFSVAFNISEGHRLVDLPSIAEKERTILRVKLSSLTTAGAPVIEQMITVLNGSANLCMMRMLKLNEIPDDLLAKGLAECVMNGFATYKRTLK